MNLTREHSHSQIHTTSHIAIAFLFLVSNFSSAMDIFQRNKSLSELEDRHLDGTTSFNRNAQNYVAPPILTPKSLSFPMQRNNFVNIPGVKLKPRKSSRAWSSVVSTLKENRPPCMPTLDLDDCHTESDYFTIKSVSNTESELVLSEPPLKKSKIELKPRPLKQPHAHPIPRQSSHQASDTTESVCAAQHYYFLPFEHKIPPRPIEASCPEHGHEDSFHAGRSCLFNRDTVDGLRPRPHSPKDRAEPTLWETPPRSIVLLSFPKPRATRGHDITTPYRRQLYASSMNNHHKECNKVLSQSARSAFGATMRCDTPSHSFTRNY
jgi:hypothetical protein